MWMFDGWEVGRESVEELAAPTMDWSSMEEQIELSGSTSLSAVEGSGGALRA